MTAVCKRKFDRLRPMKKGVFDITRESPCIRTCSIPTKSQQRCVFAWKNPRAGWSRALKNYKGLLSVEIEFRSKLVRHRHFRVETNLFNLYCANAFNWLFLPAYQGRVWLLEYAIDLDGQFLTPAAGITVFFIIIIIFFFLFFFYNLNAWLL